MQLLKRQSSTAQSKLSDKTRENTTTVKGKLTEKADEVEEVKTVDKSTYFMLLAATGGAKIWVFIAVGVLIKIQFEFYKDSFLQEWAELPP